MRIWIRNGGNPGHSVLACAVAKAESGNNDHIVSPADDWGLWQINSSNFSGQGVTRATIVDPDVNARVAIRMSGNGANWAAWCTCWADPGRDCGHGFLSSPQPGSAAYGELAAVEEALGGLVDSDQAPPPPESAHAIEDAWAYVQDFVGNYSRSTANRLVETDNAIRRL